MKKKLIALLTVLVMVVGLVTVPNASAQADETETPTSGTYTTANTWWGGGSLLVGYAAENSTIKEVETAKGYWTEGGFPWWTAVVLDLQEDGNYEVTEIIPADGTNDKGDIALTTGRIVVNYHSDASDADSVAFYNSLVVGDVLSAVGLWGGLDWNNLPTGGDVATFTKVQVEEETPSDDEEDVVVPESGTYTTANTWWGGGSLLVGYAAENSSIQEVETAKGYWTEGGFPWWTAVILDLQEDGNYVVTDIIPADGTNGKGDIALTTGRIVVNYHSDADDANSVAFYNSLVVGDVLSAVGLWGDLDWNNLPTGGDVATFSKYVADEETPSDDEEETPSDDEEDVVVPESGTYKTCNTWWGGGSYMVGYAAEDSTIQEVETAKGYWPEGGFAWWSAVVLDVQEDGTWLVTEVIAPSAENNLADVELTTGRLVVTYHSEIENATDFDGVANKAFFDSLQVGDVLTAVGLWGNEVDWSTLPLSGDVATFSKYVAEEETPSDDEEETPSDAEEETPSDEEEGTSSEDKKEETAPDTGDKTPVAMMVSVLLVAMACVAFGLKRRNA